MTLVPPPAPTTATNAGGGGRSRRGAPAPPVGEPVGLCGLPAVRARYARLFTAATGQAPPWPAHGPLPPRLCAGLNQPAPLRGAGPPAGTAAWLGTDQARLMPVGTGGLRLHYATGLAPRMLHALGLADFKVVTPGPKNTARLTEAVDTLGEVLPATAVVGRYISVLVLCKPLRSTNLPGDTLISCAFDDLPFTAFLGGLGLHHLVPGFMFSQPSVYSLQESLYHQALRLALFEDARVVQRFASPRHSRTLVYLSWQSAWRPAARALRMLYIYAHLARLRQAAIGRTGGPAAAVLGEAARSVRACARELFTTLATRRELFSDAGLALLDDIAGLLPGPARDLTP